MPQLFHDRFGVAHEIPAGEIIHWRPSVYGLLEVDGKILMVKDGNGAPLWELPGGGLNQDETVIDALKREFQEETGHKVQPVDAGPIWVGCRNFFNNGSGKYMRSLLMLYRVELVDEAREALALSEDDELGAEDITAVEWIPLVDLVWSSIHTMWHPALELIRKNVL